MKPTFVKVLLRATSKYDVLCTIYIYISHFIHTYCFFSGCIAIIQEHKKTDNKEGLVGTCCIAVQPGKRYAYSSQQSRQQQAQQQQSQQIVYYETYDIVLLRSILQYTRSWRVSELWTSSPCYDVCMLYQVVHILCILYYIMRVGAIHDRSV